METAGLDSGQCILHDTDVCARLRHAAPPMLQLCSVCHRSHMLIRCASLRAGLTKVPIDGQPKSIVKDLEDMARTYIKVRCHLDSCCPESQ